MSGEGVAVYLDPTALAFYGTQAEWATMPYRAFPEAHAAALVDMDAAVVALRITSDVWCHSEGEDGSEEFTEALGRLFQAQDRLDAAKAGGEHA